jgi:hypothetical protein
MGSDPQSGGNGIFSVGAASLHSTFGDQRRGHAPALQPSARLRFPLAPHVAHGEIQHYHHPDAHSPREIFQKELQSRGFSNKAVANGWDYAGYLTGQAPTTPAPAV